MHLVEDRPDGPRAAPALGRAAKAAIHLSRRAHAGGIGERVPHLMIGKDVARANNHRVAGPFLV